MNYINININATAIMQELLMAQLMFEGYAGFEQTETQLKCYIAEEEFNNEILQSILSAHQLQFNLESIPKQNWNQLWESNFSPIYIDNFVGVRAEFHQPLKEVQHQIIITPKMSFGTGHHATTYLVIQIMQTINFYNKLVFDFGTGTGILAIVAEKLGATQILAVDNDDWCIENALENIEKNKCTQIKIAKANTAMVSQQFDVVMANINKNIIEENFLSLHQSLQPQANIIVSGLLTTDEADIVNLANEKGWQHLQTKQKDNWIAIHFKR